MADKFEYLTNRLVEKMKISQVPVPGFIVGLSGTDSVLAFLLLYAACERMGMAERMYGLHYVKDERSPRPGWFAKDVVPWLRQRCPEANVRVATPRGGNYDPQRWADLHLQALNVVYEDGLMRPREPGENYWVAGTLNASEFALGTYSMMAASTSIMPLRKVWKGDVMAMCEMQGVPAIALENARIPDCICGRDELAAENIELIDDILTLNLTVTGKDPALLDRLIAYVRDSKRTNGFKERVPYLL